MAGADGSRPDTCCCIEITCSECRASSSTAPRDDGTRHELQVSNHGTEQSASNEHQQVNTVDTEAEPVRGPSSPSSSVLSTTICDEVQREPSVKPRNEDTEPHIPRAWEDNFDVQPYISNHLGLIENSPQASHHSSATTNLTSENYIRGQSVATGDDFPTASSITSLRTNARLADIELDLNRGFRYSTSTIRGSSAFPTSGYTLDRSDIDRLLDKYLPERTGGSLLETPYRPISPFRPRFSNLSSSFDGSSINTAKNRVSSPFTRGNSPRSSLYRRNVCTESHRSPSGYRPLNRYARSTSLTREYSLSNPSNSERPKRNSPTHSPILPSYRTRSDVSTNQSASLRSYRGRSSSVPSAAEVALRDTYEWLDRRTKCATDALYESSTLDFSTLRSSIISNTRADSTFNRLRKNTTGSLTTRTSPLKAQHPLLRGEFNNHVRLNGSSTVDHLHSKWRTDATSGSRTAANRLSRKDLTQSRRSISNVSSGRAKETYHDMAKSLQREPAVAARKRSMRRRSRSAGSEGYHERSDYSYGAAVDRLRGMLHKHDASPHRKTVQFSPRSTGGYTSDYVEAGAGGWSPSRSLPLPPRGEVPNEEETVRLLQNQSVVVQQMEAENRYCKSELQDLKNKVKTLIEENRMLHEELKRSVVAEILQGDVEVPGVPSRVPEPTGFSASNRIVSDLGGSTSERPMTVQDYGKWQRELERITTLHSAKTSRLEAQLAHAREESTKHETEAENLRAKLRVQESLGPMSAGSSVGLGLSYGLCIRCSENEAVTPATLVNQQTAVDRITKERDELMDQLTSMKTTLQEMRQREDEAYAQVKKSVEMVEQAQLEQTQALVQREQLKDELINMRKRMEEHVEEMQQKMVTERDIVRQETKAERNELNQKLKEMTEKMVAAEMHLDKTVRDKIALQAELDSAQGQLTTFDLDYNKATDSMKMSMTAASLERNAAMDELKRSKAELEDVKKDRHYHDQRTRTELSDLRRRLAQAEKELIVSKEQCITLTTDIQSLSRETHLAKLARDTIEKTRNDDVKAVTRRAEQREEELNMLVETLENKHGRTTTELDEIIRTQNGLIQKLRDECRNLTHQLEKITHRYKGDNKHLSSANGALKLSLDKSRKRVKELEQQNAQHAALADKMRQRMRQLDEHGKRRSGHILELLAKESSLMRDRQLLAREIEFLRREAVSMNDSDIDKIFAARGDMVDDVLTKVKEDETTRMDPGKAPKMTTTSSAVLIETDRGMQTDDL